MLSSDYSTLSPTFLRSVMDATSPVLGYRPRQKRCTLARCDLPQNSVQNLQKFAGGYQITEGTKSS